MFYSKTYNVKGELMVAACDRDIVGKTFSEKDLQIEVKPDFYKGEETDSQTLRELLQKSTIANLVGIRCVHLAESMGLVQSKITIQGIPHAQIFSVR